MQMKRVRLTLVLALLAVTTLGWRVAAATTTSGLPTLNGSRVQQSSTGSETSADPDTPQIVTHHLSKAPNNDGSPGMGGFQQVSWIERVWVSVYLGRWFAR